MALPTVYQFVNDVLQAQLLDADQREEILQMQETAADARELAQELLRRQFVTAFQINQIFLGKGASLNIGPFLLLERVGEGGMGQVYKVKQKVLNRIIALKVIRKECMENPKVIQRFEREIRATAALNHPHIVRAYDADQVRGTYYIAMEYIEGDDLAKIVKDHGPLPVNQACDYIRQAALGLQHAYERGLVHRDIKPANLLVTRALPTERRRSSGMIPRPNLNAKRDNSGVLPRPEIAPSCPWGMVKILDMGLARCTETFANHAPMHLTQIGSVMGTPEFIAPEQARDSHTSDVRADLYSLGCTLYFLLTGQPPFPDGTMTEKLLQHQTDRPRAVMLVRRQNLQLRLKEQPGNSDAKVSNDAVRVPSIVIDLINKLLAKKPEDRHQTPIELANDLQTIIKQMADGTLPDEDMSDTVEMPTMTHEELMAPMEFLNSTDEIANIVTPMENSVWRNRHVRPLPIVLASLGGLVLLVVLTIGAVLMGRGSFTQAGTVEPQPSPKARGSN